MGNLVESAMLLLQNPNFASASEAAGNTLRSYGGLPRAIEIIEAAANGVYLKPDAEVQARMNEVDAFFDVPQVMEQWISLGICLVMLSLIFLGTFCCCRCCCSMCCGKRSLP